jgi:outer membrane protein OmpA-like peptidoglycan-associated protein
MIRAVAVLTTALLWCSTNAIAQQPSTEEIITRLQPTPVVTPQPGFRQLPWSTKGLTEEGEDPQPSIDLHIPFDFDSNKLTPDAIVILRTLGEALRDQRLVKYRFKIAGHTDARGTEEYNQSLSERRAQAVRDYLLSQYGVQASRLETAGYGKTKLADPSNPEDGINRRVQVINIGETK